MSNKAHTATLNRIRHKYGVSEPCEPFDIRTNDMIIEVETSATIAQAIERLQSQTLPTYIAVTNKEGIKLAQSLVRETSIGVMDPKGEIVVQSCAAPNYDPIVQYHPNSNPNQSPELTQQASRIEHS